jgi:5-(carboxyamino)imidazole ribonucleotide mutase
MLLPVFFLRNYTMGNTCLVSIVMGSASDSETMKEAAEILKKFDIPCEMRVISAHRTPERAHEFAVSAKDNGTKIIIAGAGKAAHLAGVMASLTTLPVTGVPMKTSDLGGLDSLLSTVQMPGGIPVATTAIGSSGAKNAALLAVAILALENSDLDKRLSHYRENMRSEVEKSDTEVQALI